jgi:quinol monooxygenase YgiN
MKKVIIARIPVKPESIEQFLTAAKTMVEKSNLEQGCLVYKLYQEVGNPSSFIFYELYEDQEAVDIHHSSLYFKSFIEQITELATDKPQVDIY